MARRRKAGSFGGLDGACLRLDQCAPGYLRPFPREQRRGTRALESNDTDNNIVPKVL